MLRHEAFLDKKLVTDKSDLTFSDGINFFHDEINLLKDKVINLYEVHRVIYKSSKCSWPRKWNLRTQ